MKISICCCYCCCCCCCWYCFCLDTSSHIPQERLSTQNSSRPPQRLNFLKPLMPESRQEARPSVRIEIDRSLTPPSTSSHATQSTGQTPHTSPKSPDARKPTIHTLGTLGGKATRLLQRILHHRWFSWIQPRLRWPFFKPVIRCAVAVSHPFLGLPDTDPH